MREDGGKIKADRPGRECWCPNPAPDSKFILHPSSLILPTSAFKSAIISGSKPKGER